MDKSVFDRIFPLISIHGSFHFNNVKDIKPSVEPPNTGEGDQWAPVVDALDKFDSHMVESGKESIDSFLTFVSDISIFSYFKYLFT